MPNNCQIIITRGKNKGKVCSEINRVCRHQAIQCPNCGEEFSYKHTFTTHARSCIPIKRKKTNIVKKASIIDRINMLEERNQHLEHKVSQVENQPRSVHNIMVIGNDFFKELTNKIGKDSAVDFLSSAAQTGKPIDVIEKLYLEGKDPMHYPIACRDDDHFRYLSNDGEGGRKIVDDQGGAIIGDLMMNRLRNAFLMAANELISKHVVDGSTLDTNEDVLRSVQNIATVDKRIIVYQLAEATSNADHPFFRDREELLGPGPSETQHE